MRFSEMKCMPPELLGFVSFALLTTSVSSGTGLFYHGHIWYCDFISDPGCRLIIDYPVNSWPSYSPLPKEDKKLGEWFLQEGATAFLHCFDTWRPAGPTQTKCMREANGTWTWHPKLKDMQNTCVGVTSSTKGILYRSSIVSPDR